MTADYGGWATSYLNLQLEQALEDGLQRRAERIRYMLSQAAQMSGVYRELTEKFDDVRRRETVLAAAFDIAAAWSPDRVGDVRNAARRLRELNADIATTARQLHGLLESSAHYSNRYGVSKGAGYSTLEVAQQGAQLMEYEVDDLLTVRLPELLDIVKGIELVAKNASVSPGDNVTAAALVSREPSSRDAIRAFWARLGNSTDTGKRCDAWRLIPPAFRLSDASTASLLNCALGLLGGPSEITAENVRKTRSRKGGQPDEN